MWIIRTTRPDVIITRFSTESGFTHGHHTASARLALEAFTAASDPEQFPPQLTAVKTWAAKRIMWNTSPWYYRQRDIQFEPTGLLAVDVGVYNPRLGASYSEIAARSRVAHADKIRLWIVEGYLTASDARAIWPGVSETLRRMGGVK